MRLILEGAVNSRAVFEQKQIRKLNLNLKIHLMFLLSLIYQYFKRIPIQFRNPL